MKTATIRMSGGIGDAITYFSRLKSFKEINDVDKIHFWVSGGWKNTADYIIEIAQPLIKSGLISSISKEKIISDIDESWIPDEIPLKYPIQLPFKIPYNINEKITVPGKVVIIQPATSEGNWEGFQSNRYLGKEKWLTICRELKNKGYTIVMIGGRGDGEYLGSDCWDVNFCGINSFNESIGLLQSCSLMIGTNSWPWEISAYSGIPTICLYYTNQNWISLHAPDGYVPGKIFNPKCGIENLRIELNKDLPTILRYIEELLNG